MNQVFNIISKFNKNSVVFCNSNLNANLSHILPFIVWITLMVWVDNPVWSYNLRTFLSILILFILKPWKYYKSFQLKFLPISVITGIAVFFIWIFFEMPWTISNFPYLSEWYDRIFIDFTQPFNTRELYTNLNNTMVPYVTIDTGKFQGYHHYNPIVTGWINFTIHMIGSCIVIALIEEFFYRSFIYRWMQGSPFQNIIVKKINWGLLIIVSVFFSISHVEWGVAIICGIIFGLLYIKTNNIWSSIIAHGITNFLLGLYVIKFDAYQFW